MLVFYCFFTTYIAAILTLMLTIKIERKQYTFSVLLRLQWTYIMKHEGCKNLDKNKTADW